MRKILSTICILITLNSFSQKSYTGFNLGGLYAKYYQSSFDNMKPYISDSLKLKSPFLPNIKAKGFGFGILKGKDKKYEFSFNINLFFNIDQQNDSSGVSCFLNQTNTNISTLAGFNIAPWLRLDVGVSYIKNRVQLKRGTDFYAMNQKIESDIFSFHAALPILLMNKNHDRGLSIGPFYDLGVTKFNHNFFDGKNYSGNTKSSLSALGIEAKIIFRIYR